MFKNLKNKYRRFRLAQLGIREEDFCRQKSFGSGGGSWMVCTDNLGPESVAYSFGIGKDASFGLELIERMGVTVHGFDPTPVSKEWTISQNLPEKYHFHDYGLAGHDGTIEFFPPRRESSAHFTPVKRYSGEESKDRVQCAVYRLSTILEKLGHDHVDILKMDIEGGEYDVIPDILDSGIKIGQFLVEFHHCYATIPLSCTLEALDHLHKAGFRVFHISERTYEMSLINRR